MGVFDDDFDPLAPPAAGAPEDDEGAADDPLAAPGYPGEPEAEGPEDDADGGFSDHERVVRVWVEDGRLAKVRLSPVWFHKVPDAAALEARFREALMLSTLRLPAAPQGAVEAPYEPEASAEVLERLRGLPRLSRRSLVQFAALADEFDARDAAALEAHGDVTRGEPVSGRSKGVTVTLNPDGVAERVTFDPKWLDEAQVGAICTHIMRAADRAHALRDAAAPGEAAVDELTEERELLRLALLTLLKPPSSRP
ncbi:hypothetical protein GCM10025789_00950 [Tessaracoccus lubricantis]|uniref:DUF222 domain-containing protein n=1 Tax=Tessaracoccus lubricantis TaxID=545543 RepID=A0ABP9F572_9ACTN